MEYNFCNDINRCQMAKSTKYFHTQFCASFYRFRYNNLFIFDLQKVGQDHWVQFFGMTPFNGKWQNLQNTAHFCTTSHIFLPSKSMSKSQSTIFAMASFKGKY